MKNELDVMKLSSELEYWKQRCELAEKFIEESPCDPDITTEQADAWDNYQWFLKNNHGY